MACCGSGRAALKAQVYRGRDGRPAAAPTTAISAPRVQTRTNGSLLTLRYLRRESLALRGPRTGSVYVVADANPVAVHPDDAPALLRTGLFAPVDAP